MPAVRSSHEAGEHQANAPPDQQARDGACGAGERMADLVVPEEACAAEGEEKEVQNDPQREGREEDAEDDKGLLDELLSGASEDDAYDPEEDALAQEPEVSVRLSSREGSDSGSGGRENGDRDAREDGGMRRQDRNLAVRAGGEGDSAERRASDAGYPRERRERELGGRASTSMLHPAASAKAPKKFPFRALVVGIEGGLSWLDRAVLTRHFSKFGQVLDVFIPHSKVIAFVAFESDLQLQRALESPEHFLSGCTVRVKRAEQVPLLCCFS